ncbi:MAG: LysR family transcriptional regulator [Albidovulum sp.]
MAPRLPNLIWLRSFDAAARLLNFTKAAQELGLTQTAVSLHIKALEDTLGCQLFLRNPRHLALTDLGQAYVHSVRKALGDINLATVSLFGMPAKQTITMRAPISTVTLWLAPRLAVFMRSHPELRVRLVSTIWATSVADTDVDIDLRLGDGTWPGVQAEKLSCETIVPIASTRRQPALRQPEDLLSGPLIHILGYEDNWQNYLSSHGLAAKSASIRYSVDTTAAAVALVAADAGYATVLTRFAKAEIVAGAPISMIGDPVAFGQSHYLVQPLTTAAPRPEVDIVKAWLRTCFGATGT